MLEHCQRFNAKTVITGAHGRDYIALQDFENLEIKVIFQDYKHPEYSQRIRKEFVPRLSFVDLLFNRGPDSAKIMREGNIGKMEVGSQLPHVPLQI